MWNEIIVNGVHPNDVILWNIFPFHPYKDGAPLSNRTPKENEKEEGIHYIKVLQSFFPLAAIIAVGNHSERTLQKYEIACDNIPHPSNGGANKFKEGFKNKVVGR